jgi:hypothetical protein
MLARAQKLMRAELAQSMLQALAKHEHTNYHFLFTGDESWMFHAYDHRTRWVTSWADVDEIERPSHFDQKTMLSVFFNGTGEYKIATLPEGQKVNSAYFIESALRPLAEICDPQGRGTRERKVMLHLDNAPVRNTEEASSQLLIRGAIHLRHVPSLLRAIPALWVASQRDFKKEGRSSSRRRPLQMRSTGIPSTSDAH